MAYDTWPKRNEANETNNKEQIDTVQISSIDFT